ncbi:MAG: hypothetical protein Q9186_002443 [Xanthomendoza sp. 1 TL-2023]
MPSSSAILILDMRSPSSQVQRYYADRGEQVPSGKAINDRLVPPLHRWSDATWTLWKEKGGAGNLRYIAHDLVANEDTESVMDSIIEEANKKPADLPFPGLVFNMDTEPGRALLGTPNGIGAARLLIDRASTLGKRDIRFHVFYANDPNHEPKLQWSNRFRLDPSNEEVRWASIGNGNLVVGGGLDDAMGSGTRSVLGECVYHMVSKGYQDDTGICRLRSRRPEDPVRFTANQEQWYPSDQAGEHTVKMKISSLKAKPQLNMTSDSVLGR